MKQLIHNGILVPRYEPKGCSILLKGNRIALTPKQEEIAIAWVMKLGTEYVDDPKFVMNFIRDFSRALGASGQVDISDIDFSEMKEAVERERNLKMVMSKEEKKRVAGERKSIRESNKEKYGHAIVDGVRVELGNYVAEPGCIFVGRGKHPLRGRWKPGVGQGDITLNLSPDATPPPGEWKGVVWDPEGMWVAKWADGLRGKMKYVWLSDSSAIKQERDIEKFDKAMELVSSMASLRQHIEVNLTSEDPKRRKLATVCYLIDSLKLRVGDEKDRDEADTVGATTLRPSHVSLREDGLATFDFLGKDAVRWHKEIRLPEPVVGNLRELMAEAKSSIFPGVRSENVKAFLSEAVPGLTAKVLRTYHASKVVKDYLGQARIAPRDPDYIKRYTCTMANLNAAVICNHKRKLPKNWEESLAKKKARLKELRGMKARRSKERAAELKVKIDIMKATRDYNLATALKSYIDPRIYYRWCKGVGFDWRLYYTRSLQRKFSWIEDQADSP